MDRIETQSRVPVQKFYRTVNRGYTSIQDLPFDEAEHDWPVPADDGLLVQQSGEAPYSLVQCFEFIENGLLADDGRLIKEAVQKILKNSECIVINSLQITQIQAGAQQGIFKIDCKVRVNGSPDELEIPLVGGISRYQALNNFVAYDHCTIIELRKKEALSYEMDPDDPAFAEKSFFPRHFGEYQKDGVYFYLAEYLDGYREMNLFWTGQQRVFISNGLNLGKFNEHVSELESSRLLGKIFVQQLATSLRCRFILAPAFGAGDYVYSPSQDRIMLHCVRPFMATPAGFWGLVHEKATLSCDYESQLVAYQLLQLLFWKEWNLRTENGPYECGIGFLVFSIFDLIMNVEGLFKELPLSVEQWEQVFDVIAYWRNQFQNFFEIDSDEMRVLQKRMTDLELMMRSMKILTEDGC